MCHVLTQAQPPLVPGAEPQEQEDGAEAEEGLEEDDGALSVKLFLVDRYWVEMRGCSG